MTAPLARGRFITLEGVDGAGKSTHAAWIVDHLRGRGHAVVATREPGGTPVGERLRSMLLNEPMTHDSEALLMFASRREHLEHVIRPALGRGDWVVCDRFSDATYAYQGGGHGVDAARIRQLEEWVHGDRMPDLTLLFDVPPAVARARLERSQGGGRVLDKFEREQEAFFVRVRDAYLARVAEAPERFRVVDSAREMSIVRSDLARILEAFA